MERERAIGRSAVPAEPFAGKRWAIVVGISTYRSSHLDLRYADRDAIAFHAFLQTPEGGAFHSDHVALLLNHEATTGNVTRALRSFLKKPAREDLVIMYFACHGAPDPERPGNVYLLTHDVDASDIAGTALPMREIDLALRENLLAERVVIIADTCHSAAIGRGPGTRGAVNASQAVNAYLQVLGESRGGVALLTSAEANEVSYEDEKWGGGHGVFTHYLLEGMRGAADQHPRDGVVSVGELFEYVREQVKQATDHRQHPAIGTTKFDRKMPMAVHATAIGARVHTVEPPIATDATDTGVGEDVAISRRLPVWRRHGKVRTLGGLTLLVALLAAAVFRFVSGNVLPPIVGVLEFMGDSSSTAQVDGLGAWLQGQLASALHDKGWRMAGVGGDDFLRTERALQASNPQVSSDTISQVPEAPRRVIGGTFERVGVDSMVMQALLVDIGGGHVLASTTVRSAVKSLGAGVSTLASSLDTASHASRGATAVDHTVKSSAANSYVRGLLHLSRGEFVLAKALFKTAVGDDSSYGAAAAALRVVSAVARSGDTCSGGRDCGPTLAVLPFKNAGAPLEADSIGASYAPLKKGLSEMLITELVQNANLRLVERDRLQELLEKQDLAVRGRKILPAQFYVTGRFIVLNGRIELNAEIADVATGSSQAYFKVVSSADSLLEAVFALGKQLRESDAWYPAAGRDSVAAFMKDIGLPNRRAIGAR